MATKTINLATIAAYRTAQGQSQHAFWGALGVTQSAGSRYENSRHIPRPVALLLILREQGVVTKRQLALANKEVAKLQRRSAAAIPGDVEVNRRPGDAGALGP